MVCGSFKDLTIARFKSDPIMIEGCLYLGSCGAGAKDKIIGKGKGMFSRSRRLCFA